MLRGYTLKYFLEGTVREYYLVCFDVSDNKLRRRVVDILLSYGQRVQESVFEVVFNNASVLKKAKLDITELISKSNDVAANVRFYYLNGATIPKSSTLYNEPVCRFPSAIII